MKLTQLQLQYQVAHAGHKALRKWARDNDLKFERVDTTTQREAVFQYISDDSQQIPAKQYSKLIKAINKAIPQTQRITIDYDEEMVHWNVDQRVAISCEWMDGECAFALYYPRNKDETR